MIVCEIGLNHNGDTKYADKYLDFLLQQDIDAITFQIREPEFYLHAEKSHLSLSLEYYSKARDKVRHAGKKIGIALSDISLLSFFESINIDFYKINRGGDITYHGPGQIMGYPIIDLDNFFTDINLYLRKLEEVIINTLKSYELNGFTIKGETGVWVNDHNGLSKKICAFGIRASRWVTMHGFCFNINPELNYFKNIIPCGIKDKGVTSVSELKNNIIKINEIKEVLYKNFAQSFEAELVYEN